MRGVESGDTLLDAGREFGIEIDGCPISPAL